MDKFRIVLGIIAIGAALVGLEAVAARYSREIRAARERIKSLGSQVIQTDCGSIEYARVGEGYPILAVHGTMGGFDQGLLQPGPASGAGFQIIAVSRFGYLRSPMPEDADFNHQADAYACLLDKLGIRQVAITTVSGCANASIRFAARYPDRVSALILISPAAPGKVKVSPPPKAIFETLRSDLSGGGLPLISSHSRTESSGYQEHSYLRQSSRPRSIGLWKLPYRLVNGSMDLSMITLV